MLTKEMIKIGKQQSSYMPFGLTEAMIANVLRLGGRFNAAKPLLAAGGIIQHKSLIGTLKKVF